MFSVFATLGDVLLSPRLSPSAFDAQQGAMFAEHALFSRAPGCNIRAGNWTR